jgi:hypothetical protein
LQDNNLNHVFPDLKSCWRWDKCANIAKDFFVATIEPSPHLKRQEEKIELLTAQNLSEKQKQF